MVAKTSTGIVFRGIGVSPGVAAGPVILMCPDTVHVYERNISSADIATEISRFEEALIETRRQIRQIQEALSGKTRAQDASILDAHLMVLDDRTFIEEIVGGVQERLKNIEFVVRLGTEKYASVLEAVEDDYLRERVADVRDVGRRLLRNLTGSIPDPSLSLNAHNIVVARDLAPSETASLRRDQILGFATDLGSPTSHTAVMARALELPAVVGLKHISSQVTPGDSVLIDGNKGVLILNPDDEQLKTYGQLAETRRSIEAELNDLRQKPAVTKDGHTITLSANAEGIEDVDSVLQHGACGIGLLRSELLCLTAGRMLTEQEQTEVFSQIAERLAPDPLIIRTLDLGGDKYFAEGRGQQEANPFLGLRSIRLSLRYPEYFKQQLRAILRASVHGNVRIMYPMVSSAEEVVQAQAHLDTARRELEAEGLAYDHDIETGVMIEVPAAALTAESIARHVDFFSIGTNDLIQYTLAVDRGNQRVAYLYEPTHPSVLQLINMTVAAAHANGIWVGLCGEMAGDPLMTALLIGLGIDELSMSPRSVPLVKDAIRSLDYRQATTLAAEALSCTNAVDVLEKCRRLTQETAPEILELI